MARAILRVTDQRSCVVSIIRSASAKFFISVSKNVLFHLQRQTPARRQLERKLHDTFYCPNDDMY